MSARDTALRATVVKFFLDRVMDARRTINAEVTEHLDPGDRKHARLEDGTDIGTVSVTAPKGTVKVTNTDAFTAWVEENYPAAVVTRKEVTPAWVKNFLTHVEDVGDGVIDPDTGELVPGVEHVVGSPTVTVRVNTDALMEAFADGRLVHHMREVVADLPALEKQPPS